jgi:hypothetical protein
MLVGVSGWCDEGSRLNVTGMIGIIKGCSPWGKTKIATNALIIIGNDTIYIGAFVALCIKYVFKQRVLNFTSIIFATNYAV